MNKEYDVRRLFLLMLSKLWFIICALLISGSSTYIISKYVLIPKYSSYTTMYVNNKSEDTSNAKNNYKTDLNDLKASQTLVSTYIAVLQSDSIMEKIKTKLRNSCTAEELLQAFNISQIKNNDIKKSFSMSSVDNTEVLKITATTRSPEISAKMCSIISEIAPEFLKRIVGAGSVEIIDPAKANFTPSSPKILRNTLIGMLGGIIFAIIIIFLTDFFDNKIKDPKELSNKYNKAILGEVQNWQNGKKKKYKKIKHMLLTDNSVPFSIIESYKSLRTNILFSLGTSNKKVIAISSANPGEGKSTTTANLAITLMQMESKVLLIDGDLRKPIQHKIFRANNVDGLSTLIIGRSTVEESIKRNVLDNLDLLPAGPIPPNPSELLASEQFRELLEQFSQEYDYVIIDTPPINLVSDVLGIQDVLNGIMLVIRHAVTTQEDLEYCMERISLSNINMLGFVINDICSNHGSGYYKNYKYKYKYKYKNYEYKNKK